MKQLKLILIVIVAFLCITADRCNGSAVVNKSEDFYKQEDESPKSAILRRKVTINLEGRKYNILVWSRIEKHHIF